MTLNIQQANHIKFIIKRDGSVAEFNRNRITKSVSAAVSAVYGGIKSEEEILEIIRLSSEKLLGFIFDQHFQNSKDSGETIDLEELQDLVEQALLHERMNDVARAYIAHRTKRDIARKLSQFSVKVTQEDGSVKDMTANTVYNFILHIFEANDHSGLLKTSSQPEAKVIEAICHEVLSCVKAMLSNNVEHDESTPISYADFEACVAQAMIRHNNFAAFKKYMLSSRSLKETQIVSTKKQENKTHTPHKKVVVVTGPSGEQMAISLFFIKSMLETASSNGPTLDVNKHAKQIMELLNDSLKFEDVINITIRSLRHLVEISPYYSYTIAQVLFAFIYYAAANVHLSDQKLHAKLRKRFKRYLAEGIEVERIHPKLLTDFDLDKLAAALDFSRDLKFKYMGLQTIRDRYLLNNGEKIFEIPQYLWMRVAMGLAACEHTKEEKTEWAIKYYDIMSQMLYMPSTPTLFNAGTLHPQLSSCYISTTADSLDLIFKTYSDNAQMSKWAGGIGNDWTNVRASGSRIAGTNGKSSGIVPFLKIVNSATVAVNQGGKRNGSTAVYLEPWHMDIEAFLALRKNTGDERLRTPDIHTVLWMPDLFFERVIARAKWTLFCPAETPDLHDAYGEEFKQKYEHYEKLAREGQMTYVKTLDAFTFWRQILSILYETGHPWITFKDPSNFRNPQKHAGVIHSSNLCTEVYLNTSPDEIAVCNLGSINLNEHFIDGGVNWQQLEQTTKVAMRALDSVIDGGFYPVREAEQASKRHRPVGLGMCGLADLFLKMRVSFNSSECIEHSDKITEFISYHAILASADLAQEKGSYSSFDGSLWSKGIVPLDTLISFKEHRQQHSVEIDTSSTMDWDHVRSIVKNGMRNSHTMAIAPTVTIANIMGVNDSIAPIYGVAFTKGNLSGTFTCICEEAYNILQESNLWDAEMSEHIKYYDGSVKYAKNLPDHIKNMLSTAFEIPATLLVRAASRRQKWIDQGISLNLFFSSPDGNFFQETFELAWTLGLKGTYYAKQKEATQIEKATLNLNARSLRPRWMKAPSATDNIQIQSSLSKIICNDEEGCTACQ